MINLLLSKKKIAEVIYVSFLKILGRNIKTEYT